MGFIKDLFGSMTAVRWVLLVIELLLLLWFAAAFPFGNAGTVIGGLMCCALIVLTLKWNGFTGVLKGLWKSGAGKGVVISGIVVVAVAAVYFAILSVMMLRAIYSKPDKPNVVVVLGCKVRGESPSKMLRLRLDAAIKLLDEYPDVKCVVSGGKGSDEKISEAECMKNYLVENNKTA